MKNTHVEAVEARDLIQATRDRLPDGDERRMLSVVLGSMDNIVHYVAMTWAPGDRPQRPQIKRLRSLDDSHSRQTVPGRMSFSVLETKKGCQ